MTDHTPKTLRFNDMSSKKEEHLEGETLYILHALHISTKIVSYKTELKRSPLFTSDDGLNLEST